MYENILDGVPILEQLKVRLPWRSPSGQGFVGPFVELTTEAGMTDHRYQSDRST
jgi:hypothetical protein